MPSLPASTTGGHTFLRCLSYSPSSLGAEADATGVHLLGLQETLYLCARQVSAAKREAVVCARDNVLQPRHRGLTASIIADVRKRRVLARTRAGRATSSCVDW